ncbi:S8 family serine peptidase [Gynuella sunshinyii]|uniref:Subtilisin-like serine protease n=1 Tax=Gynuella sunshinyii YC6258 TaxID=1445510 RepID=A0A0C5VVL8_9GAMM|nr:S8 family serine peptidase [Gynuella sunshinyii]AJQ97343.1 subtilisin-like serine protease [Gynuella sunshinyii YC6258]
MKYLRTLSKSFCVAFISSVAAVNAAHAVGLLKVKSPVKDRYIVVMNKDAANTMGISSRADFAISARDFSAKYGAQVATTYTHALAGFVIEASESQALAISQDSNIEYVIEDSIVSVSASQNASSWGLDRIDQRGTELDEIYNYDFDGKGVNAYIIDTGIRASHNDFEGRVSLDYSVVNDGRGADDCNGHGTHVAGTVGGKYWGVAKAVDLHSVRVFGCNGKGYTSDVIAGVDWVTSHASLPAVANMSLGGESNRALDDAVNNSINSGVVYVVAAGNDNIDACKESPARLSAAITVGAVDFDGKRASFSNYGRCVDLFAPGEDIPSAYFRGDSSIEVLSGTSMAAPHVSGIVALYLQNHQKASPVAVSNALQAVTTYGVIGNKGSESPNLLAYSRYTATNRSALFRYYNGSVKDHFYTRSWSELQGGTPSGWKLESVEGYINGTQLSGTKPLYRYYNTKSGDHFYTVNWSELGGGSGNYKYEGITGYVPGAASAETKSLYRYFNTSSGDHFYTTNWNELGGGTGSWRYEGVACQVYKSL